MTDHSRPAYYRSIRERLTVISHSQRPCLEGRIYDSFIILAVIICTGCVITWQGRHFGCDRVFEVTST